MKQLLIFFTGALSMFIALCGVICAIQAIATGVPFLIICATLFVIAWIAIVLDYFKNKSFEEIAERIYVKLKNK